jgi:hypothetical protein
MKPRKKQRIDAESGRESKEKLKETKKKRKGAPDPEESSESENVDKPIWDEDDDQGNEFLFSVDNRCR